jgi:hypothetical protein
VEPLQAVGGPQARPMGLRKGVELGRSPEPPLEFADGLREVLDPPRPQGFPIGF